VIGAVIAGLMIGVAESFTAIFAPKFSQLTMYAIMVVVLLLRPQGLFGRSGLLG
jgi:branched-chain amino acid transport system permease protein